MEITHTLAQRGPITHWKMLAPMRPQTGTKSPHKAHSLTQLHAHSETKGISCLCLNPFGFGYISVPLYMDLLRTDLSSITEALGPDLALGMLRAA